jgi:hypothetical protein
MSRTVQKIGMNQSCPCGRKGKKFKACCRGKVDWETVLTKGVDVSIKHLSTRGKNIQFINMVLEALQIDTDQGVLEHHDFKRAFTSAAVRRIYEAVQFVWPSSNDLKRVLSEESEVTSGLYIGQYETDLVQRGITRHSLYADRILLVDPLLHPRTLLDEYNPLLHPELHRSSTLKWISLWIDLLPWIKEGIVGFVRAPGDFDARLALKSISIAEARYARHPDLRKATKKEAEADLLSAHYQEYSEQIMLTMSDSQIRRRLRDKDPDLGDEEIEQFLVQVHSRRKAHPYYLGPEDPNASSYSEMFQISTGTSYEQAKLIALHSGSYLMTDLRSRWREMEVDRADARVDPQAWSPFAKAFQGLPFRFLDAVPLNAALAIRKEGRLEHMRHFLRKVWTATAKTSAFDDANIPTLAAELDEKVREAEVEWKKIDRELIGWVGATAMTGLLAGGPLVAAGHAAWLAASVVAGGAGSVFTSTKKRAEYKLQYPAGFLVDLKKGRYDA